MKKVIEYQGEEIADLRKKLEKQKQRMDHALKLANQIITCRPPPRIYAKFLKEQFILFQLMLTLKDINAKFKLAQEFYGLYQTLPSWKKNLLCEFYVHNFTILSKNQWNHLPYIGDIHLRALISQMHNETNYDRQLNNYKDEERIKPLSLRVESNKLEEILRDWFILTYGDKHKEIRK